MKTNTMKNSFRTKLISAFLSLTVLLVSLPVYAFAVGNEYIAEDYPSEVEAYKIIDAVFEKEEMRDRNAKTFHLADGSSYMAVYNGNVHRHDENGVWKDIDNRLFEKDGKIENKDGNAIFAKKLSADTPVVSFTENGKTISITVLNLSKNANGIITNRKTEYGKDASEIEKLTTLDNISSEILYKGAFGSADLQYVLSGTDLKENIIINEQSGCYSYAFEVSAEGTFAQTTENGEIWFYDNESGEFAFRIPVPAMWDANGDSSDSVSVELKGTGSGAYIVTYFADKNWIDEETRTFPVTIDPPIYTCSSSDITDLDVVTTSPTRSSPGDTSIYVSNTWRAYWKLNTLPGLPSHAYISNAELSLKCFSANSLFGYIAAYDVINDWTSTLTWNDVISSTTPKGVPEEKYTDAIRTIYYSEDDWFSPLDRIFRFTITPIVQKWYNGENYGVMFMPAAGTTLDGTAQFRSNNYSTVSERPQLCITYIDQKGLEDYWTFTSQDAGFAGSGYVNNATGNLVVTVPTLTTTDALMPITPALVYNFNMNFMAYQYPNVLSANKTSFTPLSTKLNINETVIPKTFTTSNGGAVTYYVLADADGTEHYFLPNETGTLYFDEDGLLLELSFSSNYCTITDDSHTVKKYSLNSQIPTGLSAAYTLSSITDCSGNTVSFELDSSSRPTEVRLIPKNASAITQLKFLYNSAGVLYCVYNPSSKEGVVFRYSNSYGGTIGAGYGKYLKNTIRAHGGGNDSDWLTFYNTNGLSSTSTITVDAVAEYSYNYLGLMSKVANNLSNYRINYATYSSLKISSIYESTVAPVVYGQEVLMSYGTGWGTVQTSGKDDIFDNSDDLLTTNTFDYFGRTVSSYTTDLNVTQIYGASTGQYVGEGNAKNSLKASVQTTQNSSNYLLNGGFEYGSGNSISDWSTTGNVIYDNFMMFAGHACADLKLSSSVPASSIYQYVNLDKGDYNLSLQINTVELPSAVNVYLKAESMSNSAHSVVKELSINEDYATGSYAFDNLSFSAAPGTSGGKEQFKISVLVTGSVSSVQEIFIDNLMLSRTTGVQEYDMTRAGHFETSGGYSPVSCWKYLDHESIPVSIVDSGKAAFGDVLKISALTDELMFPEQIVYSATQEEKENYSGELLLDTETFTMSGWSKGTGQSYSLSANYTVRATISYYHPEYSFASDSFDMDFDKGITDWQFASIAMAADPDKGIIDKITITILYNGHPGDAFFDNISFVRNSSTSARYSYNSAGRLTSSESGAAGQYYHYDSNGNVDRIISTNKTITEYTYDSFNRVLTQTNKTYTGRFYPHNGTFSAGNTINILSRAGYSYNTYGLIFEETATDLETSQVTKKSYEYYSSAGSHVFGTLKKETDALNHSVKYFVNESDGRLTATVNLPSGNGTYYVYDGMGNLTEVYPTQTDSTGTYWEDTDYWAEIDYHYDAVTKRLNDIVEYAGDGRSTVYSFTYDNFGNTSTAKVGNRTLASYSYNGGNGKLNTLVYGNGLNVRYIYDTLDRISEIQYRNGSNGGFIAKYRYSYDSNGYLSSIEDIPSGETTVFRYESTGKLMDSFVYDNSTHLNKYGTTVYYDVQDRPEMIFHSFDYGCQGDVEYDLSSYSFTYSNQNGSIERMNLSGRYISGSINPNYDNLGRIKTRIVDINRNSSDAFYSSLSYNYLGSGGYESSIISQIRSIIKKGAGTSVISDTTYDLTYTDDGYISTISVEGSVENKYYYDSLGQLTREDNRARGESVKYYYDEAGNITSREIYSFTTGTLGSVRSRVNYSYGDGGWADLLTNYNGQAIAYDMIGNPTSIGAATLSWQGRELTAYSTSGTSMTFTYNADGIRTGKTVTAGASTLRHEYILNGSQIIKETVYSGNTEQYSLVYIYDENGSPIGYRYRTPSYVSGVYDIFFFEKNPLGDIIAVYNHNGLKLASYTYDAWGKVTVSYTNGGSSSAAQYNPFRYRGYYFDSETGWYYLQSRYYNPTWGRFLNADCYLNANGDILGFNMFAYCGNNPVMGYDPSGYSERLLDSLQSGGGAVGSIAYYVPIAMLGVGAGLELIGPTISQLFSSLCDSISVAFSGIFSKSEAKAEEKAENDNDYDPYRRPNQKKQGRERKEKKKNGGKDWEPNPNKKIKPPRKHTPGRDHRKFK